jgi:SAM-dependent methyltransferase
MEVSRITRKVRTIRRQLAKAVQRDGYGGMAKLVLRNCWHTVRSRFPDATRNRSNAFDLEWGVDTCQIVEQGELDIDSTHQLYAGRYEPTPAATFRDMMETLDIRHEDYTFVDLGSGKGRTLLLAADYPFRAIVGAELSTELHRIALANIDKCRSRFRACQNVTSICVDATAFPLPAGPLVVYLYDPFGPPVMEKVAANIKASLTRNPRTIRVVYCNPSCAAILERDGLFVPCARGADFVVYRNSAVEEPATASGGLPG